MLFEIEYHSEVKSRDLPDIPQNIRSRIAAAIENRLLKNPAVGKPLRKSLKGHWKMRVGDWRIIYRVNEETKTVLVLMIGNRKDVYSKVFRRL